jgi:hypothetical protein
MDRIDPIDRPKPIPPIDSQIFLLTILNQAGKAKSFSQVEKSGEINPRHGVSLPFTGQKCVGAYRIPPWSICQDRPFEHPL